VVANGVVYSPYGPTFNATTGAMVGSYTSNGPPAVTSTAAYVLQGDTLNALTLADNTSIWSFAGDGSLATAPIVVNQAVIIGSSTGNVYALDSATGAQLWNANVAGTIPSESSVPFNGLAAGDGLLIVPAGNKVVAYRLSANP
jgi:outer membrane protein assembly factor BamB